MNDHKFNLIRWLPVAGSLILVGLVAVVFASVLAELKQATYWREHTYEVTMEAQAFEDKLIQGQGHLRRYMKAGKPSVLVEYQNDTNAELREFTKITELTADNPEQLERLRKLESAMKAVFAYDDRMVGVYARQGAAEALKMEGEGNDLLAGEVEDLEAFKAEEKQLLMARDATEQRDFRKAARSLILGSLLAAALLVFSNFVAGREMARRRRAEAKQQDLIQDLQKALAEVRTLSGLIPICAWCKKVRADKGFWQSVESYVGQHTGARFSHGMCPACEQQFQSGSASEECASSACECSTARSR